MIDNFVMVDTKSFKTGKNWNKLVKKKLSSVNVINKNKVKHTKNQILQSILKTLSKQSNRVIY